MRLNHFFITAISLTLFATSVINAEEKPLVPLPSINNFANADGWSLALGLGVEYETAYDGSDEYEFELDPAGALQWRQGDNVFFWEGIELGWRGLATENLLLQAGARYESGLEPDESEDGFLEGIEERDSHLVGFFEARWALDNNWKNWVGARVMGGPSDFGWLGVLAAGHRFGVQTDGTGTEIFIFSTFGNAEFINKDFGVSATDALNSQLTEFTTGGGYRSTGITLIDRRQLSANLQLVSQTGIEYYSSDIKESPIARDDFEFEVGVSLIWKFF